MNTRTLRHLTFLITAMLVLIAAAGVPAVAQDSGQQQEKATLVGQLYEGDAGGFMLIEKQSGEVVMLRSEHDLSQYNKKTVRVEGLWGYDSEGAPVFVVTAAEKV